MLCPISNIHLFTARPMSNDKHPVNIFPPLLFLCRNVSLAVLFHSSCNSYTISKQSYICICLHILSQYRDAARAKEKKLVQHWMLHSTEIFLHAFLGTRAIHSPALFYTPSHSRNNITLAIVFDHLSAISSGAETVNVSIQFLILYCFIKTWDCKCNVNSAHQCCRD